MSRTCSDCPAPISVNSRGRCKTCAAKAKYADPAARKAMSVAKLRALECPEKRQRVSAAAAENLRSWHRSNDRDWSQWHKDRHQRSLSWCPQDRLADYRALLGLVGAVEAKRMMVEDIALTARRIIATNLQAMHDKAARQKAQAY